MKHNDNSWKTFEILSQYCRDEPDINAADCNIVKFIADNAITDLLEKNKHFKLK